MISADTNIIVRIIADDHPDQSAAAQDILSQGVFLSLGVLMEAEWVLRSVYGWTRRRINSALLELLEIRSVAVADLVGLRWALDRHRAGADWADMLHLLASRGHDRFATFDEGIAAKAGDNPPLPIQVLR